MVTRICLGGGWKGVLSGGGFFGATLRGTGKKNLQFISCIDLGFTIYCFALKV
jgi:hypothetical protein